MTRYVRNDATLFSEVGPDFVALDVARGECFGLCDVTADVWRLLAEPRTVTDLCTQLQAIYDVDRQSCRTDVAELIQDMLAKDLIRPARPL